MSSPQVPLWVPVVVGVLGVLGVLGGQLIAGWREDRRWRREMALEEQRWARERARERDNRSYEGRASAYTEVIGAIEAFDWVLFQARKSLREGGTLNEELAADLRRAANVARNSLGAVNVHAPERIRAALRELMHRRSSVSIAFLAGRYGDDEERMWFTGLREYDAMRADMRRDLGLDTGDDG